MAGEEKLDAIKRLIVESEEKRVICAAHLVIGNEVIKIFGEIFAVGQINGMPMDEFRVDIGGIVRLFSDSLLSGRIEDFEVFKKEALKTVELWKPKLMSEAAKLIQPEKVEEMKELRSKYGG